MNNKNRFDDDEEDEVEDFNVFLDECEDDDEEDYIRLNSSEKQLDLNDQKIASCIQDDHGLTYAVIYAHLFLVSVGECKQVEGKDWRKIIEELLDSNTLIRFYKARRDSPEFVRAKILNALKPIGFVETRPKQTAIFEDRFIGSAIQTGMCFAKIEQQDVLEQFIDQCRFNYEQLSIATKYLDRASICKALEAQIFTRVSELRYVPTLTTEDEAVESDDVLWIPRQCLESGNKENEQFLRKLNDNRYKPRLKVNDEIFSQLAENFPHFNEVLNFYKAQFRLNLLTGRDYISPVLLLGPPGIGKTVFAKSLAKALVTGYTFIDMASASASWTLSGLTSSWNGAKPGKLVSTMVDSPTASPIVLLDEIEKSGTSAHGQDPRTPLYQLLEENTAKAFTDEFVDFPVDLSRIIYIACANSTQGLTDPLLTRFQIFEIADPSDDQHGKILESIYQAEVAGTLAFPANLPHEIKVHLRGQSLRTAKVQISKAISSVLLSMSIDDLRSCKPNSLLLTVRDFPAKPIKKKKIGF